MMKRRGAVRRRFGPRAVDGSERFLEAPGFGEERVAIEQFAEPAALAFGEPLGGFQQAVAGRWSWIGNSVSGGSW
jgi:hypothetical protein